MAIRVLILLYFFLFSHSSQADCTSPAGVTGQFQIISNDYKFCDGSSWNSMTVSATTTPCALAGEFFRSGSDLLFCNGSVLVSMDSTDVNGTCSVVGTVIFDTGLGKMKWCNGTNWKVMSFTPPPVGNPPENFTAHTFTPCGATGAQGPTLAACQTEYIPDWVDDPSQFDVTDGIQEWTVQDSGDYMIVAAGASGGPGRGVIISGIFSLTAGQVLKIAVGQRGVHSSAGGGGGGSFVWINRPGNPLIVAGGGGRGDNSNDGVTTTTANSSTFCGNPGTSGSGGSTVPGGSYPGAAGAGWTSNGQNVIYSSHTIPGGSSATLKGGTSSATTDIYDGGFGGGGAGYYPWGGGGGGGYSGGGGGKNSSAGGCGGGSYNGGTSPRSLGFNDGDGYVGIYPFDASADCLPILGSQCTSGAINLGSFQGAKYMTTPSGCTNSATPTCGGGQDSLTRNWRGGTGGSNADIPGLTNIVNSYDPSLSSEKGDVSTSVIVAHSSIASDSAADYCNNLNYAGFSDWYLPSKSELAHLYCLSNAPIPSTGSPEENPNCFNQGGKKSFVTGFHSSGTYWSSTENSSTRAWSHRFYSSGSQSSASKSSANYVRCIRRYDVAPAPTAPTGLSLSHSNRSNTVILSWTAGSNASDCVLQVYDGSKWASFSSVNCNASASNQAFTLSKTGNAWNGRQVRLAAYHGAFPLATFPQTLSCTTVNASTSSTPTIDEDCNGNWDEIYYPIVTHTITPTTFGAAYSCPTSITQPDAFVGGNITFTYDSTNFSSSNIMGDWYNGTSCGSIYQANYGFNVNGYNSNPSGTIPSTVGTTNLGSTSCQLHPSFSNYSVTFDVAQTAWEFAYCTYDGTIYYK